MANAVPNANDIERIITDPEATALLVTSAEQLGDELVHGGLTRTQIRNIFGEVRLIEGQWWTDSQAAWSRLLLLKPKMAYRASIENVQGLRMLERTLGTAIDHVDGERGNFQRFMDYFEAILAYHRSHGGRD